MKCKICESNYADNYYKDTITDEIICEDCLLEIDGITTNTITQYFLDGEYLGDTDDYDALVDNICENTMYERIEK